MFGRDMPEPGSRAGRTARAIAIEVLPLAGVAEAGRGVGGVDGLMATRAPDLADLARERVRALPGAAQALAALRDGRAGPEVVQSLLTGNIRPLAEVKLRPVGLTSHLDLDAGAYGDAHEVRAELVPVARRRAALAYRAGFDGQATVLVGDTPFDVGAALATGARAVGVATGRLSAAPLTASRAHAGLPDL